MLNTVIAELGTTSVLIIAIVAILIFGGKKIPELMHGLGKGIRNFKEGMNGTDEPKNEETKDNKKIQ